MILYQVMVKYLVNDEIKGHGYMLNKSCGFSN